MKATIKAIKRGVKAAVGGPKPQSFQAGGKTIVCSHCGGRQWVRYDLEKWVPQGFLRQQHGLECSACSHMEFFAKRPTDIESGV